MRKWIRPLQINSIHLGEVDMRKPESGANDLQVRFHRLRPILVVIGHRKSALEFLLEAVPFDLEAEQLPADQLQFSAN